MRRRSVQDALRATEPLDLRALGLLFQMNYYPTRFRERPRAYGTAHARAPRLELPFAATDATGVVFPDAPSRTRE